MKKEDMYNAVSGISPDIVDKADAYMATKKIIKPRHWKRWVSVAACLCLLLGISSVCYAANVGGIQRQIQLWLEGDKTAAVIEFDGNGEYALSYKDSKGNLYSQTGGGVKFNEDGTEVPATEEELLKEMFAPNVVYEDGKAILYYYNHVEDNYYKHSLDITDLFEDDVCYITLTQDGKPLYITVKYQKGLATSPYKYLSPWEFN